METKYKLYHYPLCPFSRTVRICLAEKGVLPYEAILEKPWERRVDFLKISRFGQLPVFQDEDGAVIVSHAAICAYLNETRIGLDLYGDSPVSRSEVRRLVEIFDRLFYMEVYQTLVREKIGRVMNIQRSPDSNIIRMGRQNLKRHLSYIEWLLERRNNLANKLSLADFTAAAHLSILDYLGEVEWEFYPETKAWYARIKARPSFKSLLNDRLPGIIPPDSYSDLEF